MKLTKKTLIYIAVSILAVLILTVGTVLILNVINENNKPVATQESADNAKTQAIEALKNKDTEAAKDLFEQAKAEYEELGDTHNVVDTEAQLFLLNVKDQ